MTAVRAWAVQYAAVPGDQAEAALDHVTPARERAQEVRGLGRPRRPCPARARRARRRCRRPGRARRRRGRRPHARRPRRPCRARCHDGGDGVARHERLVVAAGHHAERHAELGENGAALRRARGQHDERCGRRGRRVRRARPHGRTGRSRGPRSRARRNRARCSAPSTAKSRRGWCREPPARHRSRPA